MCLAAPLPAPAADDERPAAPSPAQSVIDPSDTDWPQFRGPGGQGLSEATGLPIKWSDKVNVRWKRSIAGRGWSSPVVRGEQIWLTTALRDGKSLRAVRVDRESGEIAHDVEVFATADPPRIHPKNSHASPTPLLDGERIFVHYGAGGTACLSDDGEIVWKRQLVYYQHHGPASSPVLAGDSLIVVCDGFDGPFYEKRRTLDGVDEKQFIVALDKQTGEPRWRRARHGRHAYATPLVVTMNGQEQVVCPGGDQVTAYDPATGRELWHCGYQGYSVVPRPVFGNGLIFVCTGYDVPSLLAIRANRSGDLTRSGIAWQTRRAAPLSASPILVGDEIYFVSDNGVANCADARDGTLHWQHRLGGNHSASPVAAEGRIYFTSETGVTHVVAAEKKYRLLAANRLPGKQLASPAVSGAALFVRTDDYLYRIEEERSPLPGAASADAALPGAAAASAGR